MHSHPSGNPVVEVIFWIAAAICVAAELALLKSAFFPRPHNTAATPQAARGSEMLWAVIPAVGLMFLLAATWRAVNH